MMTILLLPERKFLTSPPISTWLARGDRLPDQPPGDQALLRSVFAFEGPLAVAALTRQLDVGDAGDGQWLRADPAWVRADMMTARMFAHGELGLSADEIAALTPDIAALFAEHDLVFDALTPTRWYLRCPDDLELPAFADPADAIGDDLKLHLPQGASGKRWRVLLNDIQVLLHNHPVNQRRASQGAVTVNSLWLWGTGRLPGSVTSKAHRYFGDDILGQSLARLAGIPVEPATRSIEEPALLENVADGRPTLLDLRRCSDDLTMSIAAKLEASQRGALSLHLVDGTRVLCRPLHRLRFWRKP